MGVFLKYVDEQAANRLALHLGVRNALKRAEEQVGFVGMDQRHVVMVAEHGDDLLCLAQTQKPVIDKNAGQLVANRLMDQNRSDRGIHPPRQATDHLGVAHLSADLGNRLIAVRAHGPVALEAGKADKVFVKFRALWGVMHLGVELHGKKVAGDVSSNCKGCIG